MKADELLVHCYAEHKDGQWQAFCLDFDLAAQADTFEEVRAKLDAMLDDYVAEATVGEDRAFGEQLLTRRAPWWMWVRYYDLIASMARQAGVSRGAFYAALDRKR